MRRFWIGSVVMALLAVSVFYALAASAPAEEKQRMYVGTDKCMMCHKTEAQGSQYPIWQKSAHSKAYEALAGDAAKAAGAKVGIAEPQKAAECLKCHVTAYGVDAKFLGEKYNVAQGVGCETCHGPGGDYVSMQTMKGLVSGTIDLASVGMVMPTKETCVTCHNDKSPTFTGFDFDKMFAKIAHPIPAERKAQYKAPAK
jgi:Cytochrome c554 and c-prime